MNNSLYVFEDEMEHRITATKALFLPHYYHILLSPPKLIL
jgi:hypothetical protein